MEQGSTGGVAHPIGVHSMRDVRPGRTLVWIGGIISGACVRLRRTEEQHVTTIKRDNN